MPSKKVFLKVNRPFIHEDIKSEAALEQLKNAKKGVGSYFANKNSTRQGTGLVEDEIKLLLPILLDIPATDLEFRRKVDLHYREINTVIPYERGLELEIGLELDDEKPVTYIEEEVIKVEGKPDKTITKYNTPINLEDYIRYRHALKHPYCAPSPEEAKGNQLMSYYIEDPKRTEAALVKANEIRDQAQIEYQSIKTDPKKIKMILTLLRFDIPKRANEVGKSVVVASLSDDQRVIRLRELMEAKPALFLKVAKDDYLRYKYLTDEMLTAGLLINAGGSLMVQETGDVLGSTLEDGCLALFNDKRHAALLSQLKAKMADRLS